MIRPEPHQTFDKTNSGVGSRVEPRLGFAQNDLSGQGNCLSTRLLCFGRLGHRLSFAVGRGLLLQPQSQLLLRPPLGAKIEDFARGFGAGPQTRRRIEPPGTWPLEVGQKRAARISRNRGYRVADRPKAEPVQAQGCRVFPGIWYALRAHEIVLNALRPRTINRLLLWRK